MEPSEGVGVTSTQLALEALAALGPRGYANPKRRREYVTAAVERRRHEELRRAREREARQRRWASTYKGEAS